jgi:hypothetical protein
MYMESTTAPIAIGAKVRVTHPQFADRNGVVLATAPNREITGHNGRHIIETVRGVKYHIQWSRPDVDDEGEPATFLWSEWYGPSFFTSPTVTVS